MLRRGFERVLNDGDFVILLVKVGGENMKDFFVVLVLVFIIGVVVWMDNVVNLWLVRDFLNFIVDIFFMFKIEELLVVKSFIFGLLLLKNLFLEEELDEELVILCLCNMIMEYVKYLSSLNFVIDFCDGNLDCFGDFFIIKLFGMLVMN